LKVTHTKHIKNKIFLTVSVYKTYTINYNKFKEDIMAKINITVNGNKIEIEENSTISDFVIERKVTGTMFAVEKNLEIINKDRYDTEIIKESDTLEIVGFFGGG